jgi:hypothetical protein
MIRPQRRYQPGCHHGVHPTVASLPNSPLSCIAQSGGYRPAGPQWIPLAAYSQRIPLVAYSHRIPLTAYSQPPQELPRPVRCTRPG